MTTKAKTIHERLIAFHANFSGATRSGNNPRFNSEYFTLDDLVKAVSKPLSDQGLYIRHETILDERPHILTGVYDQNGEGLTSQYPLTIDGNAHSMASQCTYGRKVNITGLLSIGENDDDGNAAVDEATKRQARHDKAGNSRTTTKDKPPAKRTPIMADEAKIMLIRDFVESGAVEPEIIQWLEEHDYKIEATAADRLLKKLQEDKS